MSQSTVTVTVAPLEAVRLTAPVDGATYPPGTILTLKAEAPAGSVLEFLCNGTVVGFRVTAPYTLPVTLSAGVKVFSVRLKATAPPPAPPAPPVPAGASPDGTQGQTVTDSTGGTWTIGPLDDQGNGQAFRNGIHMGGGYVSEYGYDGGVYGYKTGSGWWEWFGAQWTAIDQAEVSVRPFRGRKGRPAPGTFGDQVTRANAHDNAWQTSWVSNANSILAANTSHLLGKTIHIGDSLTLSQAYGEWARYGTDKTLADTETCAWMRVGMPNPEDGFLLSGGMVTAFNGMGWGDIRIPQMLTYDYVNDAQFAVLMMNFSDIALVSADIDRVIAAGIVPILSSCPPRNVAGYDATYTIPFNALLKALAQTKQIPYIDYYAEILARYPGTSWAGPIIGPDGVHFTQEGGKLRTQLTVWKMTELRASLTFPTYIPPGTSESPEGTYGVTVTDANLDVWTLGSSVGGGNFITLKDGVSTDDIGSQYAYINHAVYTNALGFGWYYWNGTDFVAVSGPGVLPVAPPGDTNPPADLIAAPAPGTLGFVRFGRAGCATFGQTLPSGFATNGLQVGSLNTQTDVKRRWPNGSIQQCTVSCYATGAGDLDIVSGPVASGSNVVPVGLTVVVTFTIAGVVWTATLPSPTTDYWLQGPVVTEWRSLVFAKNPSNVSHDWLRVEFNIREYATGHKRVVVIPDTTLDHVNGTLITYAISVSINGVVQSGYPRANVKQGIFIRVPLRFAVSGLVDPQITYNFEGAHLTDRLPRIGTTASTLIQDVSTAAFDVLNMGNFGAGLSATHMPDHGGRGEIAPYPDWCSRFILHRKYTYAAVAFAMGDVSGMWPSHLCEGPASTFTGSGPNRMISRVERPSFWYDAGGYPGYRPATTDLYAYPSGYDPPPLLTSAGPLVPDIAHQPSLAYVPYLATGDQYYLWEVQHWANYCAVRTYSWTVSVSFHLNDDEIRGVAWGLRNYADATVSVPDTDTVTQSYFSTMVAAQKEWLDAKVAEVVAAGVPFNQVWGWNAGQDGQPYMYGDLRPWQSDFLCWSLDHCEKLGLPYSATLRSRLAQYALQLFSNTGWPSIDGTPYSIYIGTVTYTPQGVVSAPTYVATLEDAWELTASAEYPPGTPRAFMRTYEEGYGKYKRAPLQVAKRLGMPGAQTALDYVEARIAGQLVTSPGWAIIYDA